jgi:hypothetical protein
MRVIAVRLFPDFAAAHPGWLAEAALCSDGFVVIDHRVSLDQGRLRPGPRQVKQTLPFCFVFGAGR